MNTMHYKGYYAKVEYSAEDGCLVGRVLDIRSVIGFHGDSVREAEEDFHAAIDFYLEACRKAGKEPERPTPTELSIEMETDIFESLSQEAESSGRTVNAVILDTLRRVYVPATKSKKARTRARAKQR